MYNDSILSYQTTGEKMDIKLYYAKHKVTGMVVAVMYDASGDGDDVTTELSLSDCKFLRPLVASKEDLEKLIDGKLDNVDGIDILYDLRTALYRGLIEIKEVIF
ncbi:hypothetical protein VR20_281 [Escherichia phage vB_EcoM_VR20]|uniref:Uncharacterized protein n=1 Tax=Escherichia phage vB_EcoM_VR20 TaxID=1567027 RepID=A0A0A7HGB0_9CAUD|nr:hypothetical protein AVV68_gp152 [Escherichia phage vB_EcoM_VR20]AIZ02339.1 hypothetical protein VR20_281 [Escherichia phage vB_EcoM_VR20]